MGNSSSDVILSTTFSVEHCMVLSLNDNSVNY